MDYGSAGLIDTIDLCRSKNISIVGVGKSSREASEPYFTTINGRRLAVLNCADDEFVTAPDNSYKCNSIDTIELLNSIARIRKEVDYIIVIIHAGNEYYHSRHQGQSLVQISGRLRQMQCWQIILCILRL